MTQFQDFDWFYHTKTYFSIGSTTYEVWHQKVIPSSQVEDMIRASHEREKKQDANLRRLATTRFS